MESQYNKIILDRVTLFVSHYYKMILGGDFKGDPEIVTFRRGTGRRGFYTPWSGTCLMAHRIVCSGILQWGCGDPLGRSKYGNDTDPKCRTKEPFSRSGCSVVGHGWPLTTRNRMGSLRRCDMAWCGLDLGGQIEFHSKILGTVSYTHLTLPTTSRV